MTALEERADPTDARVFATPTRIRRLRWTVVALAALVVALGAWVAIGQTSGDSLPADVESVLNDYLQAWEDQDIDAFEATTTSDYRLTEAIYAWGQDLSKLDEASLSNRLEVDLLFVRNAMTNRPIDWEVERVGDYVVSGDGPWFVSVEENWTDEAGTLRGTASYVIVDRDGAPRVDIHFWAGIGDLIDFSN